MPRRRIPSGVIALIVALALQLVPAGKEAEASPAWMAATGDSITRAFNTCFFPFTDCPQNSWSTGTSSTVNSHARRLGITNSAFNDAVSGAKMADLKSQMSNVVAHGKVIEYVTVLMGGNDVCTGSVQDMTLPTTFEQQLRDGLTVLASSSNGKNAIVYVVSIPNVYRLWEILHTNSTAVSRWNSYDICQALLANATSLDPADEARRRTVRARNLELNLILADVCAEYAENRTKLVSPALDCRLDDYAGFRYDFVPNDVSTRDYFHPSTTGQKTVAQISWDVGPYGDVEPSGAPVAHFTMSCSGLSCSFDASPSLDPDSGTLSYAWDFGDGNTDTASGVTTSHSYGAGNTYTVQLTVSDGALTDTDAGTFTLSGSATNSPPTASFTESCTDLTCAFTDASTDSDGSVVAWSWTFGDGNGSTTQSPTHTYAAAGTYSVSLTVTDDDGASSTASRSVTVAEASAITLSAVGYKLKGVQHADLTWSGATSANVDVYRDGEVITTTANDGAYTDPIGKKGGGSYVYKICEAGTETCSNAVTVSF